MRFIFYAWLLLMGVKCPLHAMQKEDRQIHFEVRNNSPQIITVLFDKEKDKVKFVLVHPNVTESKTFVGAPIIITLSREMRLATSQGHFGIGMEFDGSLTFRRANQANETEFWKDIQMGIPTTYVKKGCITIDEQGNPHITVYPEPDDGRPKVSYEVYEKLIGKKDFGSPEQILGISLGMNVKIAYREKMAYWHPDINKSPEAKDAFQLINWAAEKLDAK